MDVIAGRRGRLRIMLGAAPGVGKTYAMLREGNRLESIGRDVVVGLVETHGRAETDLQLGALEVLPRLRLTHGGIEHGELDVQGLIARNPEIVLVDELAHSNTPGSARPKRHDDVDVLLAHGIDVITTLNVQHIESMNDRVESITGIRVRETVPDRVVMRADEIQLVDLPVDSLIERMEAGHIYPRATAEEALRQFFRPGNLNALRELALRLMAADVDDRLEGYMREHEIADVWPAAERVLVWLMTGKNTGAVLRKGFRIASGLHGELLVALPNTGDQSELKSMRRLAVDLGAQVIEVASDVGAQDIAELVRSSNVQILVLPYQPQSGMQRLMRRPLIDELFRELVHVDIYLAENEESRTNGNLE